MQKESELKDFLKENADPYLKPLIADLVSAKPGNVHEFLCNWLETKGLALSKKIKEEKEIMIAVHVNVPDLEDKTENGKGANLTENARRINDGSPAV